MEEIETIEIDAAKAVVQGEALRAVSEHNGGIIALATGGGKSKIAINYIRLRETIQNTQLSVIIVVPTEKLRDKNWQEEFVKWGHEDLYNRVELYCYASINKLRNQLYDIVILDEVQNITPLNSEFFNNNVAGTIIGLSATPPKESEKVDILRRLGLKVVYEMKIDEAVERGIVSPFELTFIEFGLDKVTKYVKAGNKKNPFLTTEVKQYEYLTKKIEESNRDGMRHDSIKFMRLNRMRFIYNLRSKVRVAKYVLKNVIPTNERTLIFAGSINTAEELESNSFHSKSNDIAFNAFMNGDINRLSSVKSLNEGMNIPNLDNALIVQVNSKERHLIQKIGRIVRYRPCHVAKIYVMYVKGTIDEEWMKKATEEINTSNVKLLKFKV